MNNKLKDSLAAGGAIALTAFVASALLGMLAAVGYNVFQYFT